MKIIIDDIPYEIPHEDFEVLLDATVRLVAIRQKGCSHLCVENNAPHIFLNMIYAYLGLWGYVTELGTFLLKKDIQDAKESDNANI
jgi:hypothetical protein